MALIGISGKIGSGKDLTGKIIQVLTCNPKAFEGTEDITEEFIDYCIWDSPKFEIKKFADKLKDIVCILIECTRDQLEDRTYKNTELGKNWTVYRVEVTSYILDDYGKEIKGALSTLYKTEEEAQSYIDSSRFIKAKVIKEILTPRRLFELIGTEGGRDLIHPNMWINALFTSYKPKNQISPINEKGNIRGTNISLFPNWIITDVRFPNELKAITDKGGITIRVNRGSKVYNSAIPQHESEIALDSAEFNFIIDNNGTIKELVEKIRTILLIAKFI